MFSFNPRCAVVMGLSTTTLGR